MPDVSPPSVTQRGIFRVFFPLALSWMFMAIESPVSIGIISRMPNSQVNTAAFLIMMAVSLWIESPVIDLLSTSTTLAKDGSSYRSLRRFTLWLMLWVTIAHGAVAATPLYHVLTSQVLGIPPEVAEACRIPLMIMTPWSAFIGWRRQLQGLLIREGRTRPISVGTALRLATIATVGLALYSSTRLSGVTVAAIALIASVCVESVFIHVVSRPGVQKLEWQPSTGDSLGVGTMLRFHLPLTAATIVTMMNTPIISAALARTPGPVLALASWQVAISLLWLMRTITFALPEVVISMYREQGSRNELRKFSLRVGAACMAVMIVLITTGADRLFFERVLGATPSVAATAHLAMVAGVGLPLLNAASSYVRGVLTAHHLTMARLWAIGASVTSLVLGLAIGVALRWPGPILAAVAMTFASVAELIVLLTFWRRSPSHPSNMISELALLDAESG